MLELHLPWLELSVLTPLVGACFVSRGKNSNLIRRRALLVCGITLLLTLGAWQDFRTLHTYEAHDHWDVASRFLGSDAVVVDQLSAPLLPLVSLLFLLTALITPRTKVRRFPFVLMLISLALVLAMFSCREPWGVIGLLAAQTIPPAIELRARRKSVRVFALHMAVFVALLAGGWAVIEAEGLDATHSPWGIGMLIAAVLIRSGKVPFHCWMTDLFENASLGTSLLFVTPMAGAYAALRLLIPSAPESALHILAGIALVTAIYAAGMALVQREARRFLVYLFISHSSLVLLGLVLIDHEATPLALTGGLCVWLSVGLSLTGFGLTLRAVEARTGRLSLADFQGLYQHMPGLAALFLITGLASVGFPGTVGFVGAELLIESAVAVHPYVGLIVVLTSALNGIAVLMAYFRLFTGAEHRSSISLRSSWVERLAILTITVLIVGGGLFPQAGVYNRYHAATEFIERRKSLSPNDESVDYRQEREIEVSQAH